MRPFFTHPLMKPLAIGGLHFAVFVMWAAGGMPWFLEHYVAWMAQQMQGTALPMAMLMAIGLAMLGAAIVLATLQVPLIVVALAEMAAQRFNGRRGRA